MNLFNKKRINLDYASGGENPSAIYAEGIEVKKKLESVRIRVARVLGVQSRDIVFTSGGTESNNLALLGVFEANRDKINKPHFIISSLEHSAITECTKEIVRRGGEVTIVEVDEEIKVNPQEILKHIKPNTVLVSVVYANNEVGAIQPIHKISRLINEYKKKNESKFPYFHTDASQAGNYLNLQITALGVDMMTLDATKVYGPKSTGLLVVRPNVELHPILFGGGQERGLRSGTENVSSIFEFADTLESAQKNRLGEFERLSKLRRYFIDSVKEEIPSAIINADVEDTLPNIVSLTFPNIIAEFMAIKLDNKGVMVSVGSSCDSNKRAIEKDAVRFSLGKDTTKNEIKNTISILKKLC
jgi:cysteine desulfurase